MAFEVIQQFTAAANHPQQTTTRMMILGMDSEMIDKIVNPGR